MVWFGFPKTSHPEIPEAWRDGETGNPSAAQSFSAKSTRLTRHQGSVLFQPGDGQKKLTWQSCVFSLGRSVLSLTAWRSKLWCWTLTVTTWEPQERIYFLDLISKADELPEEGSQMPKSCFYLGGADFGVESLFKAHGKLNIAWSPRWSSHEEAGGRKVMEKPPKTEAETKEDAKADGISVAWEQADPPKIYQNYMVVS